MTTPPASGPGVDAAAAWLEERARFLGQTWQGETEIDRETVVPRTQVSVFRQPRTGPIAIRTIRKMEPARQRRRRARLQAPCEAPRSSRLS